MTPEPVWWARGTRPTRTSRARPRWLLAVAIGMFVFGFFASLLPYGSVAKTMTMADGALATYQTQAALLAQCGPTYTYQPRNKLQSMVMDGVGRVVAPNRTTIVPILGPMDTEAAAIEPRFATAKETQPGERGKYLRAMWDGLMVVYYTPEARKSELDALRTMSQRDDLDMVVRAWVEHAQALPGGRNFAFAVWGSSQSCHRFSAKALENFRTANRQDEAPGPSTGKAPLIFREASGAKNFVTTCSPAAPCRIAVLP